MKEYATLRVVARPEDLNALAPLAREGMGVSLPAGRSLRQSLVDDLGLDPVCVEERVQTVFLDGSPVDDIDADAVRDGCTLALAGALPGVAGIAMRRKSPVGVYREGITHCAAQETQPAGGSVALTLKLFNSVAVECLACVLTRGVSVGAGRLAELLSGDAAALAGAHFDLDGRKLSRVDLLAELSARQGVVRIQASPAVPRH
jgi:hypothetical protein